MTNGRAVASPAEAAGMELPKILTAPVSVPESRAFYSSRPDFTDGASETPDGMDEIEMAVIMDQVGQKSNGREQEILHALRYMRLHEGRVPEGEVTGTIDGEITLKGLKWLRKNIKDEDIHRSTVQARTALEGEYKAQRVLQQRQREEAEKESIAERQREAERRKADKRDRRLQKKAELQQDHNEELEIERQKLAEWCEENPSPATSHLPEVLGMFEGKVTHNGKIAVAPKNAAEFAGKIHGFIRYIAENPQVLRAELRYSSDLDEFLQANDMSILLDAYSQSTAAASRAWIDSLAYDKPEDIKTIMPKWIELMAGFSQDFKSGVVLEDHKIYEIGDWQKVGRTAQEDAAISHYGSWLIHSSLAALASSSPREFIDTAYEIVQSAAATDDEFTLNNVLYLIQNVHLQSGDANMLLLNSSVAKNVDQATRMRSVDLKMAIREAGFIVGGVSKKKAISKKLQQNYINLTQISQFYGIDYAEFERRGDVDGLEREIFRVLEDPIKEAIENGELPGSLYLLVKGRKQNSPQDA